MKRISSGWTYIHKRLIPILWYGFITLVFVIPAFAMWRSGHFDITLLIGLVIMMVFGYFFFKHLLLDLVDEAWDAGDHLVFKNKGIEESVRLENIVNVSYSVLTNSPRVTITLRTPSRLGKEITFSPPISIIPFKKSPIVDDLIQRVDNARHG
jgi:hypothetical protein